MFLALLQPGDKVLGNCRRPLSPARAILTPPPAGRMFPARLRLRGTGADSGPDRPDGRPSRVHGRAGSDRHAPASSRPDAGDEVPFVGAYGFFANSKYDGNALTMSSWALDQSNSDTWVELFRRSIVVE